MTADDHDHDHDLRDEPRLPVTLLLGLPGAGQADLLRHLRDHPGARTVYAFGLDDDATRVELGAGAVAIVLDGAGAVTPDELVALAAAILPEPAAVANLVAVVAVPGFWERHAATVAGTDADGTAAPVALAGVLAEQIEGADVVLLTGADDVPASEAGAPIAISAATCAPWLA